MKSKFSWEIKKQVSDIFQNEKSVSEDLPTVLFLHLPRTGGNTVYRIMEEYFGKEHVFVPRRRIFENARSISSLSSEEKADINAVCAHMPFGAHQYFPKSTYVTLLRDPIEATISGYYHMKRKAVPGKEQFEASNVDILEFSKLFPNMFTRRLLRYEFLDPCLWMEEPIEKAHESDTTKGWTLRPLGRAEFEEAADVLRSFDVVGITDQLDASMDVLARKLGIKLPPIQRLNSNPEVNYAIEVSNELREQLRDVNAFDVELYELACNLFNEQLDAANLPAVSTL